MYQLMGPTIKQQRIDQEYESLDGDLTVQEPDIDEEETTNEALESFRANLLDPITYSLIKEPGSETF
jgi:hypothetical protein